MDSTAARSDIATPPPAQPASIVPARDANPDDQYFVTGADNTPRLDDNVQLAAAPPWLGALVIVFWLALVIGSALRRTLLRHSGPDFPHADVVDPLAPRVRVHARSGIRAHLRPAPMHALRRARR